MVSGTTQTYSVIIIVLELTGQMIMLRPLIIACTLTIFLVKFFSVSIYAAAAKAKGVETMDELR